MAQLDRVRPTFRAVACCVVPEAATLDPAGWRELEHIVEQALAQRPKKMRRQLRLFLQAIEWLPRLPHRARFTRLDPGEQTRFLESLQRSPVLLVRRGFWGLRTLILMGFYARSAAAQQIGYRARPEGWSARR